MELSLKFILILSYIISISGNYIIIPFDSLSYDPQKNDLVKTDFLSSYFCKDLYINLTLGSPKQTIKALLRIDQYELRIKEPNYISSLSKSFTSQKIVNKLISTENFNFIEFNTSEELNDFINNEAINKVQKEQASYKEIKDLTFVYLNDSSSTRFLQKELLEYESDKILKFNYAMLGLRNRNKHLNYDNYPQFVSSLIKAKGINKGFFSFIFDKNKNAEHLGYLIIGDLFKNTKDEYEETNSTYYANRREGLSWDLSLETVYSESYRDNLKSLYERSPTGQLRVELPFILGTKYYKDFIVNEFFKDLIKDKICEEKDILIDRMFKTFACNSKSEKFREYYNNKFPDLIFAVRNIEEKLILTKEDLFFYNTNNKSDTNIYFNIFFNVVISTDWHLGRTFFQKYRFSFDTNDNKIIYHSNKNRQNIKGKNMIMDGNDKNQISKIILIIFLCMVIFILGVLFHRAVIKKPRKVKANELDDEFIYQEKEKNKKINDILDINNEEIKNKQILYLELGSKKN